MSHTRSAPTPAPHPASYWAASAPPAPAAPPLMGDAVADVVVIGAGFTGLSTAWHLQRAGISAVVLEANDIGWGASGRNGGMLPPRYKKGFATLAAKYGHDVTQRLHRLALEAVDTVEAIVADCAIDCGFARTGQLTAALSPEHLASLEADAAWAAEHARDRTPRMLSAQEAHAEIGGGGYVGGWLDPRGAGMHPLRYVRGLAHALIARGTAIHSATPVLALQDTATGVIAATPGGSVRAKHAVIATNAYTDLQHGATRDLAQRVIPVTSSVIATHPLGANVAASVVPGRQMVADSRNLMFYFRMMPDGVLVFGGRGDLTGRRDDPSVYKGLERGLAATFPQAAGAAIAHRWSGKVAVTMDDFPHVGRLSPRVAYAMGYGGRGVALSNLMGRLLADMVRGVAIDVGPMDGEGFRPIPFHAFRVPGMRIVAGWYRFKDRRGAAAARAWRRARSS